MDGVLYKLLNGMIHFIMKQRKKIIESFFSSFPKRNMNLSCHDKFQLKIGLSPYQIQFSVTIFVFSQSNMLQPQPRPGIEEFHAALVWIL
jgi:hypothetical protein